MCSAEGVKVWLVVEILIFKCPPKHRQTASPRCDISPINWMGQEDICGGVNPAVLDVPTRHVRGGGVEVDDGVLIGEIGVGVGFVG